MITAPSDILSAIFADMDEWAKSNHGTCAISSGPEDLFKLLTEPPPSWRIILHWQGDQNPNERVRGGGVVINTLRVVVDGNLGPSAIRNIALIRTVGSKTPLLEIFSAVRARMLAYEFPWLAAPNNRFVYQASDDKVPLPDGLFVAAYNLLFSLPSKFALPDQTIQLSIPEANP